MGGNTVSGNTLAESKAPWQPVEVENWQLDQIKYHYDVILGKMLQNCPQSSEDIEVPYLKAQHVHWDGILVENLPTMWASPWDIEVLQVEKGDLLVCEGGEAGRAAIIANEPPENCIIQNALHLVRPKQTGDANFLRYLLLHAISHEWLDVVCNRATIAHLTVEKFSQMWVWLPPLSEQQSIACYLDRQTARLNTLIATKQRLLQLLAEKRRALITYAVTRGLDPDAPMRDSDIEWLGRIPKHWQIVRLKHLGRIGNGSTPLRENNVYWQDGTFPWLTSTVVNDDVIGEPIEFVTETALHECHLPIVRPNSVLVALTGEGKTRGKAALLRYQATINQHMAFISPQIDFLLPKFLQLYLSGLYEILRMISEGAGSTKGALTCEQIGEFPTPLPSLNEQQAIVSYIESKIAKLDALKTATEQTIALLQERQIALITAAVTGQIRVTT